MIKNELSQEVWEQNYKAPQDTTISDTWDRCSIGCSANELALVRDKVQNDFREALDNYGMVPGGRIMANIGISGRAGTTMINCFTHHPRDIGMEDPDSIGSIYTLIEKQAQILKSEGGYGTNFSFIRPAGNYIAGIGSRTPGVLKFMELWDKSSEIVTSGHDKNIDKEHSLEKKKIRKGAQMGMLNTWHPEIFDFVTAKQTPNRLTKFNLSVYIDPGFMDAVISDGYWNLEFPDTTDPDYKTQWNGYLPDWKKNPNHVTVVHKIIKARELWDLIMQSTYNRAEPGIFFGDLVNNLNPLSYCEVILQSNPCGELPMATNVCDLGSVNLVKCIFKNDSGRYVFDWNKFKKLTATTVRYLDNILDITEVPLKEYREIIRQTRRIGCGVLGLGSLHYILGLRYGSPESLQFIRKLFKIKAETELYTSARLGLEKGSFELFDKNKYFSTYWWKNLQINPEVKKEIEAIGYMRNSHHGMGAPTGNTAIFAECDSSGIEPVYLKEYIRWSMVSESERSSLRELGFEFPDKNANAFHETKHLKLSKRGDEEILSGEFNDVSYEYDKNRGLIKASLIEDYGWKFCKENLSQEIFEEYEKAGVFVTTDDLGVNDHLDTLEIMAHFTNSAISKTINIPNDYPYEEFKQVYLNAYRRNIKGITTYRSGTMTTVLEKANSTASKIRHSRPTSIQMTAAAIRPKIIPCNIHETSVAGTHYTVLIGLLENKPYEIFATDTATLHLKKSLKQGFIRKVSKGTYLLLDNDHEEIANLSEIIDNPQHADYTRLISTMLRHGVSVDYVVEQLEKVKSNIVSLGKAMARVLKHYVSNYYESRKVCPDCTSSNLSFKEGCYVCNDCGSSKCG
jgi:ribonucleoside-diphosphate reductase alpha chain